MTEYIDKEYFPNGKIKKEKYFKDGRFHRLNGPAIINYNEKGDIVKKIYFINGKEYDEFRYFVMITSMKAEGDK